MNITTFIWREPAATYLNICFVVLSNLFYMMSKMPQAYNFYKIWTGKFTHYYLLDFLLYGKYKTPKELRKKCLKMMRHALLKTNFIYFFSRFFCTFILCHLLYTSTHAKNIIFNFKCNTLVVMLGYFFIICFTKKVAFFQVYIW